VAIFVNLHIEIYRCQFYVRIYGKTKRAVCLKKRHEYLSPRKASLTISFVIPIQHLTIASQRFTYPVIKSEFVYLLKYSKFIATYAYAFNTLPTHLHDFRSTV